MAETDIVITPEAEPTASLSLLGSEGTREFIRYTVASAIALSADFAALAMLTNVFDVSYLFSGAIAFILGLCIIYLLSVRWVFAHRHLRNATLEFAIFAGIGLIGLGLNELILWLLTGFFGVYVLISKITSVIFVFSWNFAARKFSLFA